MLPVLPSKSNRRIKRLFIFILSSITNAKRISFYSKHSYLNNHKALCVTQVSVYRPMRKDSNITKLYFKNYKRTNYPQIIPTEQFLQMLYGILCLKIRWKYISKYFQKWLNDKIKTLTMQLKFFQIFRNNGYQNH